MQEKDILVVIEELGKMISTYKDEIKFKDYEIEALKNRIERLEGGEQWNIRCFIMVQSKY